MTRLHLLVLSAAGYILCMSSFSNAVADDDLAPPPTLTTEVDSDSSTSDTSKAGMVKQVSLWMIGLFEFWLVGSLLLCSVMLWLTPLWLRSLDLALRPSGLSRFFLIRSFASHTRVIDAWIESCHASICEWNAITLDEAEETPSVEVRGRGITLSDATELREQLIEEQICLVVSGTTRRFETGVLQAILRLTMQRQSKSRLCLHPMIPVVLDRNCFDRLTSDQSEESSGTTNVRTLLRSELQRIDSLRDQLTEESIELLLNSNRVLVVVEDWDQTPVQVRDSLLRLYSTAQLSWLVLSTDSADQLHLPGVIRISEPTHSQLETQATEHHDRLRSGTNEESAAPIAGLDALISDAVDDDDAAVEQIIDIDEEPELASDGEESETLAEVTSIIEQMGCAVRAAIPAIGDGLRSTVGSTRRLAAAELSRMVTDVAPYLANSLDDEDPMLRRGVITALAQVETLLNGIVTASIDDTDVEVRSIAATAISARDETVVPALIRALEDDQIEVRRAAATALGRLGAPAAESVPRLVDLLDDSDTECRRVAAIALGRIGIAAKSAAPRLSESLSNDESPVRIAAAESLAAIGYSDPEIIAALCTTIHDDDSAVRRHAIRTTGWLGVGWPECVPALQTALRSDDPGTREFACNALENFGPIAKPAVDDLKQCLKDRSPSVRKSVITALARIDLMTVPLLRHSLDDDDADVRRLAAATLGGIGLAAVPALIDEINHVADSDDSALNGTLRESA